MKIALTADLHLTTYAKNPERFNALENILDQLIVENIETLIISGDLFDASANSPGEFEKLVSSPNFSKIQVYLIPGNHDPISTKGTFSSKQIHYFSEPAVLSFAPSQPQFVFIPYGAGPSMGDVLSSNKLDLKANNWYLVGHGDWLSGTSTPNPYETGLYMPISGRDISLFQPRKVFLGHIHAPVDSAVVHYPGSPCAVDPTETGFHSFIVIDVESGKTTRVRVDTDVLYFSEKVTVIPVDQEEAYIRRDLSERVSRWGLAEKQKSKTRIRIVASGYSSDRERIKQVINEVFKGYHFVDPDGPDISKVHKTDDVVRAHIAECVRQKAEALTYLDSPDEPTRDDLILSAMQMIFGG